MSGDPWLHISWGFWALVAIFFIWEMLKDRAKHRPVEYVETVIPIRPTPERPAPAVKVKVGLDNVQEEAVWALTELGWSRKAAIAALTASGWGGGAADDNSEQMVIAALRSMPGHGVK